MYVSGPCLCLVSSEEGIGSLVVELWMLVSYHVGVGKQWSSTREMGTFNHQVMFFSFEIGSSYVG